MATQIILPKDAEDKEVQLDTELLYDEYGNPQAKKQRINLQLWKNNVKIYV